jgi:hypothetical protein
MSDGDRGRDGRVEACLQLEFTREALVREQVRLEEM